MPTINRESEVDFFLEDIVVYVTNKFDIERNFPLYAHEDARDIISELKDDLKECKEELRSSHLLERFKDCAHQQVDDSFDSFWALKEELENSSDSSTFRKFTLNSILIFLVVKILIWKDDVICVKKST